MTKHDNVSQEGIMKATEYFKKHGYKKCKSDCETTAWLNTGFWIQLKRLVESHELLGIIDFESPLLDELVNELIETGRPRLFELGRRIKQAIADVEACHEVN